MKTTSFDLQAHLYETGSRYVLRALAGNPHLASSLQSLFLGAPHAFLDGIHHILALNSSLAVPCQEFLATRNESLQTSLAANSSLAPHVQATLVDTAPLWALEALAQNPSATPEVLDALAVHSQLHEDLAAHPALSPDTQVFLAQQTPSVRPVLAKNPSLVPAAQRIILEDPHVTTRRFLASSPALAPELQVFLAQDEGFSVQLALAKNPSLQLDESFPVSFYLAHFPDRLADSLDAQGFRTEWCALAHGWTSSLQDLLAAITHLA